MRFKKFIFSVFAAGFLFSCATKKRASRPQVFFPSVVAVLPFHNYTNDLQGPDVTRSLLEISLNRHGYRMIDAKTVNSRLKEMGITDGGQLGGVRSKELGAKLGADGLLYGDLLEFKNVNLGVFANRKVELKLKLVDAKTGDIVWEKKREKSHKKFAAKKPQVKKILVEGYAEKVMENIRRSPLREESEEVVRLLVQDLNKIRKK
ncbi:MAG: DUF799 family lipoprotein [Elusimicrobia bacterium]|nr:DUF799 family lipoprotein [Elusimicrobiota bacterium]